MLLSYTELVELVEQGVIDAPKENINGSSIEVTLDDVILVEKRQNWLSRLLGFGVSLAEKESIKTKEVNIAGFGYSLVPGEFILASTKEVFNLPNDIVAEYVCKSSMCRNGLNHLLAGYADPGWHGSKLTLELKNDARFHNLELSVGQKIGQIKFYRVTPVPDEANYANTGQYNGQTKVQQSKGIR